MPSTVRPATEEDIAEFGSLRDLHGSRGFFIGDGARVSGHMIRRGAAIKILCTEDRASRLEVPDSVEILVAPRERLDEVVGFRLHQGIMAMGRIPDPGPIRGTFHVALDRLANAENVGSVLRTCAAFGVDGLIVGPGTSSPWLRRSVRVSMAAGLRVPVHIVDDLPSTLRPLNAWAGHIHGERRDYRSVDYREPVCLVLGSEADGVCDEVREACRGVIYIPMAGDWDCLNVASSAAVLLAEVVRQRSTT